MKTKFKRGEKVLIKSCPVYKEVEGAKAVIVRVRVDKDGNAFYKVRVGGNFYIPQYALDEHLEKIEK